MITNLFFDPDTNRKILVNLKLSYQSFCRKNLGVPESVFQVLLQYVNEHKTEFRTFEPDEALTLLLVHMRTGLSFSFLEGFVNLKKKERVNVDTISLTIKKVLYILVAENPNQKTFANDMELTREKAEKIQYHNSASFKRIKKNLPGQFFKKNVGWDIIGDDIRYILKEGSSSFHKCQEMDLLELQDIKDPDDTGRDVILRPFLEEHQIKKSFNRC